MAPWRSWRVRRRLAGVAGGDERFSHIERLRTGAWWATTDSALYCLPNLGDPERVPFGEIASVRSLSPGSPVVVVTALGRQPLVGDLHPDSAIAEQLRQLGRTAGE